jgi:hypothetical protein
MELLDIDSLKSIKKTLEQQCQCTRTWVLVVHNDFQQIKGYERNGNNVDLENLQRVFQGERHCRFAELSNCNKEQILGTLSSKEKLIKLFHPHNNCKFFPYIIFNLPLLF